MWIERDKKIYSEAKTYTERMFVFRELGNLSEEEAEKAIRLPLKGSGYRFDDDFVKKIIEETAGYPTLFSFTDIS